MINPLLELFLRTVITTLGIVVGLFLGMLVLATVGIIKKKLGKK